MIEPADSMWEERKELRNKRPEDHRTEFEVDRTRTVHCASFRRLQGKTQILGIKESDFHRTRLTHSIEVASIAVSILNHLNKADESLRKWLPDRELIETISLLHDIGHPPFGHGGEVALNCVMHNAGGFEGNGQTLRIVSRLEKSHKNFGLNLTRRTILGILKYPQKYTALCKTKILEIPSDRMINAKEWSPPKCYLDSENDIVNWLLENFSSYDKDKFQQHDPPSNEEHGKTRYKTLDSSIMELADDIAYSIHDLEDAIALHLLSLKDGSSIEELKESYNDENIKSWTQKFELGSFDEFKESLFSKDSTTRKNVMGALINAFVESSILKEEGSFDCKLLGTRVELPNEIKKFLKTLKTIVKNHVILSQEVQSLEYGGQLILMHIYDAIVSNPDSLLDNRRRELFKNEANEERQKRVICDYIASMTDEYAYRMHERLFGLNSRSVFEPL